MLLVKAMRPTLAALAALALLGVGRTWAQDTPVRKPWVARVSIEGKDLRVNDQLILRVRHANGGVAPGERATLAGDRLAELVRDGLTPGQVRTDIETETRTRMVSKTVIRTYERKVTRRVGKGKKRRRRTVTVEAHRRVRIEVPERYQVETEARLVARGKTIAVATRQDATASGNSRPSELAGGWESALKKALAIPGLAVSDDGLVVPLAERRVVRLGGAARGPITLTRLNGAASAVQAQLVGGTVVLTGSAIGRETVLLEREGATARIDIAVQPFAARVRTPRPVELTGRGIRPELVARMVVASARAALEPLSGADVKIEAEPAAVQPPAQGKALTVAVPISAVGPEMVSVRQVLRVPVLSRALARQETEALFFSNDPERLTDYQTLYFGRLTMDTARLLYHHQSAMSAPIWFVAELINDGDAPSRVQVVGGHAGPVRDTVWVGYRAAADFFTDYAADSGAILEVPAHSRMAFQATRLPANLTLSGLMQLRRVSGPAPLVRIAAERPGESAVAESLRPYPLSDALLREATRLSAHVYPKPTKKLTARYAVGGRWAFLSIGRAPIGGVTGELSLEGNYGVFYDMTVTLSNPTEAPAKVQVVFEPAGGLAGAVFVIDGKRVEIPQTRLPNETTLATYQLAPGATRTIQLRTLPLSGSNYPVNLVVKS